MSKTKADFWSAFSCVTTFTLFRFHYFVSKQVGFNQRCKRIVLNYALIDLNFACHVALLAIQKSIFYQEKSDAIDTWKYFSVTTDWVLESARIYRLCGTVSQLLTTTCYSPARQALGKLIVCAISSIRLFHRMPMCGCM